MGEFLRSLSPKTRILLALILGAVVIMLFGMTLLGFLSARRNMERVNRYNVAIGLARQTDADFQLSISKGKNFAILKDDLNKKRALDYFKKAQGSFAKLSKIEEDPEGKTLLYQLGAGLNSVEFPLGLLTSTAKRSDSPEKLYTRYLKDVTIDFDNASQAYVDYLGGKILSTEGAVTSQTQMDLLCALIGAFLGLTGMGLSYSIAHNLNQALRNETASQERYRILSNVAEEAILIHDQGVIVDVNPALTRMLGYTASEVIGQHVSRFMDPDSAETTRERIRKGYPEKSYELTARRKDGTAFPLLVHGRDIEYEGRKLRLSCGWDMTEWKKAEQALKESEERFRRFAEVTKEGILIHERGIIQDVNQTLADMAGLPASEIIGKDSTAFLTAESVELVKKFRREGYPTAPYEVTLRRPDGTLIPAEADGRDFPFGGKTLRVVRMWDITERKKAEEVLRESRERFERFAEVTEEGILIHENGIIVDLNQALAEMTGFRAVELVGTDGTQVLTEESAQKVHEFQKVGYPKNPYEITLRRKDGTVFPAEVHGRPFDYDGRTLRVASFWDITERKKAGEDLQKSDERFKRFAAVTKEGIYIHDSGRIVDANETLALMLGYSVGELIGLEEVFFDRSLRMEQLERFKKEGFSEEPYEMEAIHKDGTRFPVEVHGRSFELAERTLRVVSIWDITERKRAEEALRRSEERFRAMLENSYEGITLVGEGGAAIYISPSNKKLSGYETEERVGRNVLEMTHPEDLPRARSLLAEIKEKPGQTMNTHIRLRHKTGKWLVADVTVTNLLRNPDVGGILINFRDITERVAAEEALKHSEEKFRSLIDNSYDVISITGKDRTMSYISPSVKRVLGYDSSERIGQGYAEIMHPGDVERVKGEFSKLVGISGASWTVEFRLRHKDGSWRNVESTGTNLLENPAVQGIVYNLRDITERKHAEDTLRHSEENFRNLIEKSPDAVLVHRDGKVVYANPKLPALIGYDGTEELLGRPAMFAVHPDDQKIVDQRIQTLSQGGKTSPIEMRLVRKDGTVLPVETASINIQFEGSPAIMVNIRDITARKQAEAAVQESQERYRSLIESMPDAVMVHDEENILYVNPSAVKTFGAKNEEEFIGKPFWMVVPAEFRDPVRARLRAVMERGAVNELAERKLKRMDGSLIDVLVTSVPFYDSGKRVVLAIFLDITPLKEAERKAQKYQRLAALGEMAAGMAHEIRNPTAAISAQAQYLLKKMEGNGPAYEQLKDILQQCDRLETLVHDTLDYSPEKKFEERTEIPAKDLLQKALWLAQTQFGPSHARVKVILDAPEKMPVLRVHPTRMDRVLVNLILNAFQAMPEGGNLLLGAKSLENKVVLRVQDDGKGIMDEEMARLFEPFYTSRKMGSGLGLAICQKIVEEHQGKIQVERVEPQGAAFTIELPVKEGKSA